MKVKPGYILKKVMNSYMIINTDPDSSTVNAMQTMNETGAFLWNLMENDTTPQALCEALVKEYDVDIETAKKDIDAFIKRLENSNLLLN